MSTQIYISYADADADWWTELEKHLSPLSRAGQVILRRRQGIQPGVEKDSALRDWRASADMFLLLLSADASSSEACHADVEAALRRHEEGTAEVVPIAIRSCLWLETGFSHLPVLPDGGEPLAQHRDPALALTQIIQHVQERLLDQEAVASRPAKTNGAGGPRRYARAASDVPWGSYLVAVKRQFMELAEQATPLQVRANLQVTPWMPPFDPAAPSVHGRAQLTPVPLSQAIRGQQRLVILGEPGSGKSTGLFCAVHEIAAAALEGNDEGRIPVLIELAEFRPEEGGQSILDLLKVSWARMYRS